MDDSLKGKNREGLLDSPDSGLPPSPSPPFCSLSPGLIESRSGSCTTPVESHHGYYKKESREGKLLPYLLLNATGSDPRTRMYPVFFGESIERPISYRSTTIIYPKHAKNTYRTTLKYNPTGSRRWFVSTVQLESSEDTSPCIIYTEDL
eukprot:superscaffoldBa00000791_g7265